MSRSSNKQKIECLEVYLRKLRKDRKEEWRASITNPKAESIVWRKRNGKEVVYGGI